MKSTRSTITYYAPRPNLSLIKPKLAFFSFLASGIKYVGNWLLGNTIGELILSSQKKLPINIDLTKLSDNTIDILQYTVITHDNAHLNTAEFKLKQASNSDITVIYLPGAGNLYQQDINEYINMAKKYQCSVVSFNYRGTGESTGKPISEDHLIIDCIAQVQRLLDKRKSIVLYSPSLGGAIGAKVANYFDLIGSSIYHINFKSFSSMTNVITGLIRTQGKTGHYEYPASKVLGLVTKPIINSILWLSGWELEALSHYIALPHKYKISILVRSPKDRRTTYGNNLVDDPQITHYASMYAALKYSGNPTDQVIKMRAENITDDGHSYQCKLIDRNQQKVDIHLSTFFNSVRNGVRPNGTNLKNNIMVKTPFIELT